MGKTLARNYKAKDEELPTIAGYVAFSLTRDLTAFEAYSPKFNSEYVERFNAAKAVVEELVFPTTETTQLVRTTQLLYGAMDELISPLNYLNGYLKMARNEIKVTATQFGITAVRAKARSKDAEGCIKALKVMNLNIEAHKAELMAHGLKEEMIQQFKTTETTIYDNNQLQYEIMSRRKALVQNNLDDLNNLYANIMEICDVGKILYKATDPQKLQEYTFTELVKRVRLVQKQKGKEKEKSE